MIGKFPDGWGSGYRIEEVQDVCLADWHMTAQCAVINTRASEAVDLREDPVHSKQAKTIYVQMD